MTSNDVNVTNNLSTRIRGIPGEDASAAKGGFYYQDLVTALAWVQLKVGQSLLIEVAEDLAVGGQDEVEIRQIRNVARPLTIYGAIDYLNKVVTHQNAHPNEDLVFSYVTTAEIGIERAKDDRPSGIPGIEYWRQVQLGSAAGPLVDVLKRLANENSPLLQFLSSHTVDEVNAQLIVRVNWAVNSPRSDELESRIREEIASLAYAETGYPKQQGRGLLAEVLHAVTRISTLTEKSQRHLSRDQLLQLIKDLTLRTLPVNEYEQLKQEAAIARNLPIEQIDADIRNRLSRLQQSRFFQGAGSGQQARTLAKDVQNGGRCQIGSVELRALALSWCARVLLEADSAFATELNGEAEALVDLPNVRFVRALIKGKKDVVAARALMANQSGQEACTIRFALERNISDDHAINWLRDSELGPSDFDPDGQFIVLNALMKQRRWMEAEKWQSKITDVAPEECCGLYWGCAYALVVSAVPDYQRDIAVMGVPIADELDLRDTSEAVSARRRAAGLFKSFSNRASEFGLERYGIAALEYSLWLQLEDTSARPVATAEIRRLWNESNGNFQWLPLAIRAGIEIDLDEIASDIARHRHIYGSLNEDAARAQIALLLASPPEKWVDEWDDIRPLVAPYFNEIFLTILEVQGFSRAGRAERAQASLSGASDLPSEIAAQLQLSLDRPSPDRELEVCRGLVSTDNSPPLRRRLVLALERAGKISEAIEKASELFKETETGEDGQTLLSLLMKTGAWAETVHVIDDYPSLMEQSPKLAGILFKALFNLGRWKDARTVASNAATVLNKNDLTAKLAIYSGKWDELGLLLETAKVDPDLSPSELMQFSLIAVALGKSPLSKHFTKAAVAKAADDPKVLLQGYTTAVRGRWEHEAEVTEWMQRAIATSGEGGPVRMASLSELMAMAPKWREKTDALNKGIATAELFLAMVAQQVNRPLASLMLGSVEQNVAQRNPSQRVPITTFAAIERAGIEHLPKVIALDSTALLTMARLDILDQVKNGFDRIYLPHSLGAWLFEEMEQIQFHQPSRIADAREILNAIARNEIEVAKVERNVPPRLVGEVGLDLAQLLIEVQRKRAAGEESFVVRPSPVHRPGSTMDQDADVREHAACLRSACALARSLYQHGAIGRGEFDSAMIYLNRVDQGWSEDPIIPKGASLYLDDLTVSYLQHLGLLRTLSAADFRVFVHPDVKEEAVALDRLDDSTQVILAVLDRIRRFLMDAEGENGKVRMLARPRREVGSRKRREPKAVDANADVATDWQDDGADHELDEEGGIALLRQMFVYASDLEYLVFDDRAANRYAELTSDSGQSVPVRTTLDVLDWLRAQQRLTDKDWLRSRTELRRYGYIFLPITADELLNATDGSFVQDGNLVESVEARAIRENYLLAQASGMLQHPFETRWIMSNNTQIQSAIRSVWARDMTTEDKEARSAWLVELSRIDGFVPSLKGGFDDQRWNGLDAMTIGRIVVGMDIQSDQLPAYNDWLERSYLQHMARRRPVVFSTLCQVVEQHVAAIAEFVNASEAEIKPKNRKAAAAILTKDAINALPKTILDHMTRDKGLLDRLGLEHSSKISLNIPGEPTMDTEALYLAAATVIDSETPAVLKDSDGGTWQLVFGNDGAITARQAEKKRSFEIRHAHLFSKTASKRLNYLESIIFQSGLNLGQMKAWLDKLESGPITTDQLEALEKDLGDSPASFTPRIRSSFEAGTVGVFDAVPLTPRYYQRLVGEWKGQHDIAEYARATTDFEIGASELQQLEYALLRSAHSTTVPLLHLLKSEPKLIGSIVESLLPRIDVWSLTGLVEGIVKRPDAFSELAPITKRVILHFLEIATNGQGRFELAASFAGLVDGTLSTSGAFVETPPFWRRLASISHAALLERVVLELGLSSEGLVEWADNVWSQFQAATLTDLYAEPRWNGYLLSTFQLRQELIGRVIFALDPYAAELERIGLKEVVLGGDEGLLQPLRQTPFSALPGPLEGAITSAQPLPDSLAEEIRKFLADDSKPLIERVLMAAHVGGLGILPSDLVENLTAAAQALDNEIGSEVSAETTQRLLVTLSLTSAGTRHKPLCDAVHRLLLHRPGLPLPLRAYAGITACAWTSDENDWSQAVVEFVGSLMTREFARDDAKYLLFVLGILCDVRPLLRTSLTQLMAKLRAIAMSLN